MFCTQCFRLGVVFGSEARNGDVILVWLFGFRVADGEQLGFECRTLVLESDILLKLVRRRRPKRR
jgi:hypothetical protein